MQICKLDASGKIGSGDEFAIIPGDPRKRALPEAYAGNALTHSNEI